MRTRLSTLRRSVLAAAVMFAALPAYAQSLDALKKSGALGEKGDGYVGAVTPAGESAAASINAKRRAEYEKIAAANGQSVSVVEQMAGQKLVGRAESGEYVMSGGSWKKK